MSGARPERLRRIAGAALAAMVVVAGVFCALAIYYWVSWPGWVRVVGAGVFPLAVLGLWFAPLGRRRTRRGVALGLIAALLCAYMVKTPIERDWIELQDRTAFVTFEGDLATIHNYRDAIYSTGAPAQPRWRDETFDLSQLEGADLILQPFGDAKALAHVMLSFGFADGRHVVVSMEARRVKGGSFDPLAGFFRHDQIYPELGTERDLLGQRLSRTPPDEMDIYPIRRDAAVIRIYFERILDYVNTVHARPKFYSTLRESCMTTFMNLAPESFADVPWTDLRRWAPGYSLSLFQQLGLVDAPDQVANSAVHLGADVRAPQDFATDAEWSAHIRENLTLPQP